MAIYGQGQAYYFYVRQTAQTEFQVGEAVLMCQDSRGTRFSDKICHYYLLAKESLGNSTYKLTFRGIRATGDAADSKEVYPTHIISPFTTDLFLIGQASGAVGKLRGPCFGGRIATEDEARNAPIVAIGETAYVPARHDLFSYTDANRRFVPNNRDPISSTFLAGTPYSSEEMDYSCFPAINRTSSPTPVVGTYQHNAILISPWHMVTANHFPWTTDFKVYDASAGTTVTRSIQANRTISTTELMAENGVDWLRNKDGATDTEKYQWTIYFLKGIIDAVHGSGQSSRLDLAVTDLRLLLLNTPTPTGVNPASFPRFRRDAYSKLGYGVLIDTNRRGFIMPVEQGVAGLFGNSVQNNVSPIVSTLPENATL